MTTRSKSTREPVTGDLKVTPSPEKIESPVNLETPSLTEDPVEAPAAAEKAVVETDVRMKLARKTDSTDNPFIPSNPAQVEADAKRVAAENGFDLNRGTSVGARLMARAQGRAGR